MTINVLGNLLSTDSLAPAKQGAAKCADPASEADDATGSAPQVSSRGQLMNQLEQLEKSDPAKFKQVTEDIAQKLRAAAGQTTGAQADWLNKLADKFDQASQSGDISSLNPPKAGGHSGHHHHVKKYNDGQEGTGAAPPPAPTQPPVDIAQIIESSLQNASG